jgi:hypothetical protein
VPARAAGPPAEILSAAQLRHLAPSAPRAEILSAARDLFKHSAGKGLAGTTRLELEAFWRRERLAGGGVAGVASRCLLFGSEEALDDLRQHRLDGERVVGGVRHDCELVCGPQ